MTSILVCVFLVVTPRIVKKVTEQAKRSLNSQTVSFGTLVTQPLGNSYLLYQDSGTTKLAERARFYAQLFPAVSNITIYGVDANKLYDLEPGSNSISSAEVETFEPIYQYNKDGYIEQVIYPWIEETGIHRYTFVYSISENELQAVVSQVSNETILSAAAVLVIVNVTVLILLQYLFVRPVNDMSRLALAIGAGQYDIRIRSKRHDEIGDLASSINTMSETLQADIAKLVQAEKLKSEFLIISSHNFRTPLTVITGFVELLQDKLTDQEDQEYLTTISEHTKELVDLTDDMLTIAELEGGAKPQLNLEPVDVVALMRIIETDLKPKLAEKSLELDLALPDASPHLITHKTYLTTALWNILDNAIKFTPDKGYIRLAVSEMSDTVRISVSDTGTGIAPQEVEQLFTKFHRGTSVMRYEYEGVGLGLYMTKLMLSFVGGNIEVTTAVGKGSTFTIVLPLNSAETRKT